MNTLSIAESSGIPRETVRRKVANLVREGWIYRSGSTLHFTSKGYRETRSVREAMERLAVEYSEIIGNELPERPPAHPGGA
jgi:DNA-binding IclR family transcriptional regulator